MLSRQPAILQIGGRGFIHQFYPICRMLDLILSPAFTDGGPLPTLRRAVARNANHRPEIAGYGAGGEAQNGMRGHPRSKDKSEGKIAAHCRAGRGVTYANWWPLRPTHRVLARGQVKYSRYPPPRAPVAWRHRSALHSVTTYSARSANPSRSWAGQRLTCHAGPDHPPAP